jgi:hypothetical protein
MEDPVHDRFVAVEMFDEIIDELVELPDGFVRTSYFEGAIAENV